METTITAGISFPKKLLEKIDKERGDVSRSRFVVRALESLLGGKTQ